MSTQRVANRNAYIYTKRGLIKISDVPTPDNYQFMLDSKTIEIDQLDKEKTEDALSPRMEKMLAMIEAVYFNQATIKKGQEEIHKKLDHISEQIERLSAKISDYQALTERQLKLAESEEEVEKIISAFSDEVVSKIQRSFSANYEETEYRQEQQSLLGYFGETWSKVSEQSKKYLISARLMFKKQSVLGDLVDYSGVCLLVTKALELEMARRFYTDYIVYLRNRFGDNQSDLDDWPVALVKRIKDNTNNSVNTVAQEHSFTLGAVAYALCYKYPKKTSKSKKATDLSTIIDFANNELFETPKNFDDAKSILHKIAKEVDFIRENYRNPSAHKNALDMESAEECINYVIAVQRVMVKILSYMKY